MGTTFYETSSDEFVMENTIELRYEVDCAPVDVPLSTSPILRTGTTTGHKNVRTIYIFIFLYDDDDDYKEDAAFRRQRHKPKASR